MQFLLTDRQRSDGDAFAAFVDRCIAPQAGRWDREQALPDRIVRELGASRFLVGSLPVDAGGSGMDMLTLGLLHEELGRGCASVRNLVAVQGMVAHAILKWGTTDQAGRWVAPIGTGELVASFALTEPDSGSDARSLATRAQASGGGYVLYGRKKWISFGTRAALFLVFATLDGEIAAFLVDRRTPGLSVAPMRDLLGLRASDVAEISFDACPLPPESLLCRAPFAFDLVATGALDYGRYSTACGAVGLAEACLRASLSHAAERRQFGVELGQHQLVRRMLTDMIASVAAARLLCREAASSYVQGDPDAVRRTLIAKYFASTAAFRAADDAVQIHGATGCGPDAPVQRHLRDAKVQEIIEGTSQIHQLLIAQMTLRAQAGRFTPHEVERP